MSEKNVYTASDTFDCPVVGQVTIRKLTRQEIIGLQGVSRAVAIATDEEKRQKASAAAHAYDCKLISAAVSDWPDGEPDPIMLPDDAFTFLIQTMMRFTGFRLEGDPEPDEPDEQEQLENLPKTPSD